MMPVSAPLQTNNTLPRIGLDIGGTLAKVAYLTPLGVDESAPVMPIPIDTKHLIQFRHFDVANIDAVINFIKDLLKQHPQTTIPVTGGGAYKYNTLLKEKLGVEVQKRDEMHSVVRGLTFVLSNQSDEVYQYWLEDDSRRPASSPKYPFLVVNIGSGVSIIRVTGPEQYERVSGTCIGGGTVLGLCKLAIGVKDFSDVIRLSQNGNGDNLDLCVKELIGDSAGSTQLPHNLLAASFGKLHNNDIMVKDSDFAYSAIRMVSYNLGYVAYLVASINQCETGKYICDHGVSLKTITEGCLYPQLVDVSPDENYQSLLIKFQREYRPSISPCFLRHDGFLGAIGALIFSE